MVDHSRPVWAEITRPDGALAHLSPFAPCLAPRPTVRFFTPNRLVARHRTMKLRAFGPRRSNGTPILLIPPLSGQDAGVLDLMRGHSLVRRLVDDTGSIVHLSEWVSATPDMSRFTLDDYLSDLNVALDDLGGRAQVVGLGVGGCLALALAARFPAKVARLALAGTPADPAARPSAATRLARRMVERGDRDLHGDDLVSAAQWLAPLGGAQGLERAALETLQRNPAAFGRADLDALAAYDAWAGRTLDLPAPACRGLLTHFLARADLAGGHFVALGRPVDLRDVRAPLFVLAGAQDAIAPKEQALAALDLVGTPRTRRRSLVAAGGHYALFAGAGTLAREWRIIAGWLTASPPAAPRRHAMAGSVSSSAP